MNKFEFYIDGVKQGSSLQTNTKLHFQNESDITIMCDTQKQKVQAQSGSVDEIRIYDTNLSNDNIKSLTNNHVISDSAYQTRNVGYVYYEKGLIVITDPRPKYQNCF